MSLLLLILLILLLFGGLPHFGYHSYGYRPPGLAEVLGVALAVPAGTTGVGCLEHPQDQPRPSAHGGRQRNGH